MTIWILYAERKLSVGGGWLDRVGFSAFFVQFWRVALSTGRGTFRAAMRFWVDPSCEVFICSHRIQILAFSYWLEQADSLDYLLLPWNSLSNSNCTRTFNCTVMQVFKTYKSRHFTANISHKGIFANQLPSHQYWKLGCRPCLKCEHLSHKVTSYFTTNWLTHLKPTLLVTTLLDTQHNRWSPHVRYLQIHQVAGAWDWEGGNWKSRPNGHSIVIIWFGCLQGRGWNHRFSRHLWHWWPTIYRIGFLWAHNL